MSQIAAWGIFGGYGLWDYVTCLFDNIPKIIYFLYAALASCLDLLQCLMRKLAGLDTYWVNETAYTQQDPILEFIYGILGIGKNAGAYSVLNTVFWSLAIFGVIVLVICTIVAIIKSHYGEDANKTNPMGYIYTAVKAIITFAIVPVATIIGIYLSQFMLQTLDNITAGRATEDTVKGIYGSNATSALKATNGLYTHYDIFGLGDSSTSVTFSGMMFRAAAYDANRIRYGGFDMGGYHDFDGLLGQTDTPMRNSGSYASMTDEEWLAYQVDYAFMNNLQLQRIHWNMEIYEGTNVLLSIASVDPFTLVGGTTSFSKYNVGLVWAFYNLWKFNIMVGFASIVISFGILTGVIIGLMSRLVKTAALFLIYPSVLGIAPLDEFGAFKKWRTEFISQILMAFGAILGMNIFFLILPYVNEIQFFQFGLANYIVSTLIIIVGLLTVKSFIAFVSSLIGAADALATGDGMKKDLTATLAKAGGMTLGAANVALKGGFLIQKQRLQRHQAKRAEGRVHEMDKEMAGLAIDDESTREKRVDNSYKLMAKRREEYQNNKGANQKAYDAEMDKVDTRAKAMGIEIGSEEHKQMRAEAEHQFLMKNDKLYEGAQGFIDRQGHSKTSWDNTQKKEEISTKRKETIAAYGLNEETGNYDKTTLTQIAKKTWGEIAGALIKGLESGAKDLNINLDGIVGVFQRGNNNKYKDGQAVGSYTPTMATNEQMRKPPDPNKPGFFEGIGNVIAGTFAPPPAAPPGPPPKGPTSDQKIADASVKIEKAAEALLKATERMKRFKP